MAGEETSMSITSAQKQVFVDALASAFDSDAMAALFRLRFEKDVREIVPSSAGFRVQLAMLVERASLEGWLHKLVRATAVARPNNQVLNSLAEEILKEREGDKPAPTMGGRSASDPPSKLRSNKLPVARSRQDDKPSTTDSEPPPSAPKVFISYRRDDAADATGRLHDHLEARFGKDNVFRDIDAMPIGVNFREHIDLSVAQCDVLLVVIGVSWINIKGKGAKSTLRRVDDPRDYVRIEIESALNRKIPVVPVLVGKAEMPSDEDLPESIRELASINAAELRDGRDYRTHMDRLVKFLESIRKPDGQ